MKFKEGLTLGVGLFVFFIWFASQMNDKRQEQMAHEITLAKIKCEVRK